MTNPQDHNSEVSSKQKFPKRRQNAEEERKRQEQTRHKVNGEKGDQLEAALSFFFFTLGIKLHQRAESQQLCDSRRLRKKSQDAQDDVTELSDLFDAHF